MQKNLMGAFEDSLMVDYEKEHVIDKRMKIADDDKTVRKTVCHSGTSGKSAYAVNDVTNILVVGDNEIIRNGLSLMLAGEDTIAVIDEAENINGAMTRLANYSNSNLIAVVYVNHSSQVESIRLLKNSEHHAVNIVAIVQDTAWTMRSIQSGADVVLNANVTPEELKTSLRLVNIWRVKIFGDHRNGFALVKL